MFFFLHFFMRKNKLICVKDERLFFFLRFFIGKKYMLVRLSYDQGFGHLRQVRDFFFSLFFYRGKNKLIFVKGERQFFFFVFLWEKINSSWAIEPLDVLTYST